MKLLIEIPEETYDYWKEHKHEYVLSEAIANGKPLPENGEILTKEAYADLCIKANCAKNIHSTAPQEPRKGHWIRVTDKAGHLVWECDKCGWQQRLTTNYCPDCSADMREV